MYYIFKSFHGILNLNSRTEKQRFRLLISILILYDGDTKCDLLEPSVIVFRFCIGLFYLMWSTFRTGYHSECQKSRTKRGLTFVKELHTPFFTKA